MLVLKQKQTDASKLAFCKASKCQIADETKGSWEKNADHNAYVSHFLPVLRAGLVHWMIDEERVVVAHEPEGDERERVNEAIESFGHFPIREFDRSDKKNPDMVSAL